MWPHASNLQKRLSLVKFGSHAHSEATDRWDTLTDYLPKPCVYQKAKIKDPLSMDFPGKNTGMGCHALLQGIFPTQGSYPGLLHCRQILYHLSHQGSPSSDTVLQKPAVTVVIFLNLSLSN